MKKSILKITIMVLVVTIFIEYSVFAVNSTSDLKNEKASNNQEINNAQSELKEVQAQKSKAVSEVEKIEDKISSYENEIEQLEEKIATLNNDIKTSEDEVAKLEEEAKQIESLLAERLVLMYEDGNTSYVDFLLSSESLTDFLSKYYMVSELASYDAELLEKNEAQKNQLEEEKAKLKTNKNELETSKSKREQTQTELEVAQKEKKKQVAELTSDEKEIQARIDQLREDNKAIDAQIAAVQAQIEAELKKQKEAMLKKSSSNSSNTSTNSSSSNSTGSNESSSESYSSVAPSSSGFIRPVTGYSVTTGWYYSSGALHGAVDFSGAGISGKPVLAVADGIVVTTAALSSSYGNYIIIAHYNGLYTLYAHGQSGSISVSQGQKVTQGQHIMRVGSTGNSTGPHLHFEVRTSPGKYANRVNPLNYLP